MPQRKSKKRGQGEGSISQVNGKYVVRVLDGRTKDGKPRYKSVTCATMREATAKLTELNHAKHAGQSLLSEQVTTGVYLDYWLDEVVKPSKRPGTYHIYATLLRLHAIPNIGHIQLARLKTEQLQRLINAKSASSLAPASVHKLRGTLRTAFKHAVLTGRMQRNPATEVTMGDVTHRPIKFFTPDEARSFLLVARQDRFAAAWFVALLGLREGELLGLRWDDVDFTRGLLHIRQQLTIADKKLVLSPLKTKASQRTLPLPPFFVTLLDQHRAAQQELRHWNAETWHERGLVFTNNTGGPIWARVFLNHYHELLDAAGLERRRFHDLRHSCASLLMALGIQPKVIQLILGHATLLMTDHYTHVYDENIGTALTALGKLLTDPAPLVVPALEVELSDNE